MTNPSLENEEDDLKVNGVDPENSDDIFEGKNPAGWGDSTDRDTNDDA